MTSINVTKQNATADTPVLFFECLLASGDVQRWSTYAASLAGNAYLPRVLSHNLFELQLSADEAVDGLSHLSLTLANADSALSQINRALGFKGGRLTVYFAFVDLSSGSTTTESTILFRGVCSDPDEITETYLKLTFTSRLSLQRVPVPDVRIQRTCPWMFPATPEQRQEAAGNGLQGSYSKFYRCGYSPDVQGGAGNLINGTPATGCNGTRQHCQERGMFSKDSAGVPTARFGGLDFVPASILVRTAGDKTTHMAAVLDNSGKYNDPAPLVYGTGWLRAPVIFARNDGNLTHIEVLLSAGQISNVLKVVVQDVEIPRGVAGFDMTGTGWYQLVNTGSRNGTFDSTFDGLNGDPLGDPYGSMAVLAVTVPNEISKGTSLPTVEVLLNGLLLEQFDVAGSPVGPSFNNNPAWVILDVLRRSGWLLDEINIPSFARAAQFCSALIPTTDAHGSTTYVQRYQTNLIVTKRQSAAAIIRGVRVASGLLLRYGANGLLELLPEGSLANQQPTQVDGSNSSSSLNGGWPAYEFSDGSGPFSGIARMADDSSSVRVLTRRAAELSNRLSVEFQDEANEFQQDSLSVVDSDDAALIGCEVSSQSTALGLPNLNQAARVLTRQLRRTLAGNTYVEWITSFRALKVRPGDIITLTYLKEGFERQPMRVLKLAPSTNFETVTVLAQWHDDGWYADDADSGSGNRTTGATVGIPRPVVGLLASSGIAPFLGAFDLQLTDSLHSLGDGTAVDTITVGYAVPGKVVSSSPLVPLVNLTPTYSSTGGTLPGGMQFYYAVSSVDSSGAESALSFTIPAAIPAGTDTNAVTLTKLSFPQTTVAFNVYRGTTPQALLLIAKQVPLSSTYVDSGSLPTPAPPPDMNFDHVNVYYRAEWAGPFVTTAADVNSISYSDMGAVPSVWRGATVRIISGTGSGQERSIADNGPSSLTVSPAWTVVPDATSQFVVAESTWRAAGVSTSSPMTFDIAYRTGTAVHISARSANIHNVECPVAISPVTRFVLGGTATDGATPGIPFFVLDAPGAGQVTLSQVGFSSTQNVASITSGTLQLLWIDERAQPSITLAAAVDTRTSTLNVGQKWSGVLGSVVQIGTELLTVVGVDTTGFVLTVLRGVSSSGAAAHASGEAVQLTKRSTLVIPFANGFFLNRASMNFIHSVNMPDIRIAAAEMFVTNAFGDSQVGQQCYTTMPGRGLRTLSGGQFALQVSGPLATQQKASMPLAVESAHAMRDVRAIVATPPSGYNVTIDLFSGADRICSMTIPDGATTSNVVDGAMLGPLAEGALLSINIALQLTVADVGSASPGRDLTVTVRL